MEQMVLKVTKQLEETGKFWADFKAHLQDILESDIGSDSYHIAIPLMQAIDQGIKDGNDAINGLREDIKSLSDEPTSIRPPSKIPVPGTSKLSIGQTRRRIYEDDEERPARRQRTTSPAPHQSSEREHDINVSRAFPPVLGLMSLIITGRSIGIQNAIRPVD